LEVGLPKSDSQTLLRPTLVAMATKICEFQHKMAITQPCVKDYNLVNFVSYCIVKRHVYFFG